MSGIVQHNSALATTQSVAVTLGSPVTAGNMLIAIVGYSKFNSVAGFDENSAPSWTSYTLEQEVSSSATYALAAYKQTVQFEETYALTVEFASNDGTAKHVHLFEISGYDTLDQTNTDIQLSTTNPSVGLAFNTSHANELVLAAFLDQSHSVEPFTAGSGYTAAETTNSTGFSMFTESTTISAVGQPSASATIPNSDIVYSLILTFYSSTGGSGGSGGGRSSSSVFLGAVTEVSSIPSGEADVFVGTVSVVSQAPSGAAVSYLGQVRVVTAPAGRPNPALGQVVVLSSPPNNGENPWLGSVATS